MFMFLVYVFAVIGVVLTIYLSIAAYKINKQLEELEKEYDDFEMEYYTPFIAKFHYTIGPTTKGE